MSPAPVFSQHASPAPDPEEGALLVRARAGDREAIEALLARCQGPLLRYSLRMCQSREDAEEVLQESLLSAALHLGEFRGDSKLSTWLFTIARRLCLRRRRRTKHEPPAHASLSEMDPGLTEPGLAPEERVANREILDTLDQVLTTLAPENREILVLRDVEGLSAREVAEVVGMGEAQVKSRLHRARVAVRGALAEALAEGRVPEGVGAGPCPNIEEAFSRHLEGEIDASMCADLQRHVDSCRRCRGVCDSLQRTLAVCRAVPEPRVPDHIQEAVREALRSYQEERG